MSKPVADVKKFSHMIREVKHLELPQFSVSVLSLEQILAVTAPIKLVLKQEGP